MVAPNANKTLFYENDTFSISFTFYPHYVGFELYNKTDDGIRINWDEVSTSINGYAKRIVHYETGSNRITEVQPPTTVPPKSKLKDAFIITDQVRYKIVSGQRVPVMPGPLYPVKDYGDKKLRKEILAMAGQRTSFFVPYYIRNQFNSITFEFIVESVKRK